MIILEDSSSKIHKVFKLTLLLAFISIGLASCKKSNEISNQNILVITTDSVKNVLLSELDYRPIYHYTPPINWMNDPNGLVFYKGQYHLFYQYNPNGNVWGPMNWGHATSTDLYNWQDLPIALTPDNLGTIFSGSAVIDVNNTAGFRNGTEDPMIAIFTHNGQQQYQSIAYSNDKGVNWTKYTGNPVLANPGIPDFRDPKVFWYSIGQKWIMILAAGNKVNLYSSSDLKSWKFLSDFGADVGAHSGVWECPDLFELPVEGTSSRKWVLLVSCNGGPNGGTATQYFIGNFDGTNYSSESNNISWIDYGTDNYAGTTYNNIPSSDGRRIMIGWMSNWSYADKVPTTKWRSTMTIPRVLSLANTSQGLSLKTLPVNEYVNYETNHADTLIQSPVSVIQLSDNKAIKTGSYEINFTVDFNKSDNFILTLGDSKEKLTVNFDKVASLVSIDRSASGQVDFNGQFKQKIFCPFVPQTNQMTDIQFLIDKTSIELFLDHGNKVITALFFPVYQYNILKVQGSNNVPQISNFSLKTIVKSLIR